MRRFRRFFSRKDRLSDLSVSESDDGFTTYSTSLTGDSEDVEPVVTRRPVQTFNVTRDGGLWEESQRHATPHSRVRRAAHFHDEGPSTTNAFGRSGDRGTSYKRSDHVVKDSSFFLGVSSHPRLPPGGAQAQARSGALKGEVQFDDQQSLRRAKLSASDIMREPAKPLQDSPLQPKVRDLRYRVHRNSTVFLAQSTPASSSPSATPNRSTPGRRDTASPLALHSPPVPSRLRKAYRTAPLSSLAPPPVQRFTSSASAPKLWSQPLHSPDEQIDGYRGRRFMKYANSRIPASSPSRASSSSASSSPSASPIFLRAVVSVSTYSPPPLSPRSKHRQPLGQTRASAGDHLSGRARAAALKHINLHSSSSTISFSSTNSSLDSVSPSCSVLQLQSSPSDIENPQRVPEPSTDLSYFDINGILSPSRQSPTASVNTDRFDNPQTFLQSECVACMETLPFSAFPTTAITKACRHPLTVICIECVQRSLESQFASKVWNAITCPLCFSAVSSADMQRHASAEIYSRYDNIATRAAMQELENFVWCPSASCGAGQIHTSGAADPMVVCILCYRRSCFVHGGKWHEGLTCAEVDDPAAVEAKRATLEAARRAEEEARVRTEEDRRLVMEARRLRKEREEERQARCREEREGEKEVMRISKRCIGPNCKWRAEKDKNCKHVKCTKCRFEYCWVCMKPWKTGHLNVRCAMSDEQKQKAMKAEETDVIEESKRTAEEERRARQEDERFEREFRERRWQRSGKQPITSPRASEEREKARRKREERLGEIEVLMSSKKCPGRGCRFWVQNSASFDKHVACWYCHHAFCWVCLTKWTPRHVSKACEPSEAAQFNEAVRLSKLEREKMTLEQEQCRTDKEEARRMRMAGSKPDGQRRQLVEKELERVMREIAADRKSRSVRSYYGRRVPSERLRVEQCQAKWMLEGRKERLEKELNQHQTPSSSRSVFRNVGLVKNFGLY